jgi:hypothetical protein
MRSTLSSVVFLGVLAASAVQAATIVVTDLDDGAGSCPSADNCTLRTAIVGSAPGDTIVFDPTLPYPATLLLDGTALDISHDLVLQGPGADRLILSARELSRVFIVSGAAVEITDLGIAQGWAEGIPGIDGADGSGENGTNGRGAEGGCIRIDASANLTLRRVGIAHCVAIGSRGGNGGSGIASGGRGGNGGYGGGGRGGAIAVADGRMNLIDSSIRQCSVGAGPGGDGGNGGNGGVTTSGDGGDGGPGGIGRGGAVWVAAGAALLIRNSTLVDNYNWGSDGGKGGDAGGGPSTLAAGGRGGDGGNSDGGQLYLAASLPQADIEFSTFGPAQMDAGMGGNGGIGAGVPQESDDGYTRGEIVFSASTTRIRNSVLAGDREADDCDGAFNAFSASGSNIDTDNSCTGFTIHASRDSIFEQNLFADEGGRAVMRPRPGGVSLDAAEDCSGLDGAILVHDQSGRPRPLDDDHDGVAQCDIGALEGYDALFFHGFDP